MQIEIDLNKLERGMREGQVKVTRGGKTFWRKQRIGRKEVSKVDKLTMFRDNLTEMSDDDLKEQMSIIESEYPAVRQGLVNWYRNESMKSFDGQLSGVFNMPVENSRSDNIEVDLDTAEGYKKIYFVTQEYLSRTDPDGEIIIHRGLGPKSYQRYKNLESGESIDIKQYNVSSWTSDYDMALEFAKLDDNGGVMIEAMMPNDRVFIHPDCAPDLSDDYGESEIIVMGNEVNAVMGELIIPESEDEDD